MNQLFSLKFRCALIFILGLISLLALNKTDFSLWSFLLFDFSWLAVLYSLLSGPPSYTYFFAASMLFLGYWLKLMFFTLLQVPLVEPVGDWNSIQGPAAWDRVLMVSSMIAIGLLTINQLFIKMNRQVFYEITVPNWYQNHQKMAWGIVFVMSFIVNVFNIFGKFYASGLIPTWILPFHLNLILIWLLFFVPILCMAAFIGWDSVLNIKHKEYRYYLLFITALITSFTTISRSLYVFWTVPLLLFIIKSNPKISRYVLIFIVYLLFAMASLFGVSALRNHYYLDAFKVPTPVLISEIPSIQKEPQEPPKKEPTMEELIALKKHHTYLQLKTMFVGRWVGIEGIMATVAYPEHGWSLLLQGLTEKNHVKSVGIYSEKILQMNYQYSDKILTSSLPGLGGFLNYSNSLFIVYFGTLLWFFILMLAEAGTFALLKNEMLQIQMGLLVGYWCVAGFNIPYLSFVNLIEYLAIVGLLYGLKFVIQDSKISTTALN